MFDAVSQTTTLTLRPGNFFGERTMLRLLKWIVPFIACIVLFQNCLGTGSAATAVPGQTMVAPLSTTPVALGYDFRASKLYAIVQNNSGTYSFGSLDQKKGVFTAIPSGSTLAIDGLESSIQLTLEPSNMITSTPAHAFMITGNGLIDLNIGTQSFLNDTSPSPSSTNSIEYDSMTSVFYAPTPQSLTSVQLPSGKELVITTVPYGSGGFLPSAWAINPYTSTFYVIAYTFTGDALLAINENTGSVSQVQLKTELEGLAFDASSQSSTAALYGFTQCCPNSFVRINTATGEETVIAVVGGAANVFPFGLAGTSNGNDSVIAAQDPSSLTSADTTIDRAWYVSSPSGETAATLDRWMTQAGKAAGMRAAALTKSRTVNVILTFGNATSVVSNLGTQYGANFRRNQFQSTTNIQTAVLAFADGWFDAIGTNENPSLRIVVGITSLVSSYTSFTKQHGAAWAAMISALSGELSRRIYKSRVSAMGGLDMELAFSSPVAVKQWAEGFGSKNYADFGDAAGCPPCGYGWTMTDIVNEGGTLFFPEIYSPTTSNAASWAAIAKAAGNSINIIAALSELTSCVQKDISATQNCNVNGRIDSTPELSWIQLSGAMKKSLSPSLNIEWRNP